MSPKWTTIADQIPSKNVEESSFASDITDEQQQKKSRKIALAMGSTGAFLILVGSAPFFLDSQDSELYSADISGSIEDIPPDVPLMEDIIFTDESDIQVDQDPVTIDIPDISFPQDTVSNPIAETTVSDIVPPNAEINTETTPLPVENIPEITIQIPENTSDIAEEIFDNPVVITDGSEDQGVFQESNFPENTHVGNSDDPIEIFHPVPTQETLHASGDIRITDDSLTMSTGESVPETGLPLLPLLGFSGVGAWMMRRKKK